MDKYEIGFTAEAKEQYKKRLINQTYKLIPMREHDEDWENHLNTLREETAGLVKLYNDSSYGLTLMAKLEGLTSNECDDFMLFRKTVFRCIDLLSVVINNG
jgi:hypothetical protein